MSGSGLDLRARLRVGIGSRLEEGAWNGPIARALAEAWGSLAARAVARPLTWEGETRVLCVGGATLGGSGKTPLAIACARALAQRGARVALVGHGYAGRARAPRLVRPDDDARVVGDEAIVAARALDGLAPVVVGPSRQSAFDRAAALADVVVLDGCLQTTPRRATLSLLALDGSAPWGCGSVAPRGDLRTPVEALLSASDRIVVLRDEDEADDSGVFVPASVCGPRPTHIARWQSRGAFAACDRGELVPWSSLRALRVGLFVALARPARLLDGLARRGVVPLHVIRAPNHGFSHLDPARLHSRLARVTPAPDVWLASPKCSVHLESCGIPHAVLDHRVELPEGLFRPLARLGERLYLHPGRGFAGASLAP